MVKSIAKQMLSLTAVLAILLCCCMTTHAATSSEENTVSPNFTYLSSVTSNLSFSGSTAYCRTCVTGIASTTKIVIVQNLQRYKNGAWSNVNSWFDTSYKTYRTFGDNTQSSLYSATYRVYSKVTVYSGSKSETVHSYSTSKTI